MTIQDILFLHKTELSRTRKQYRALTICPDYWRLLGKAEQIQATIKTLENIDTPQPTQEPVEKFGKVGPSNTLTDKQRGFFAWSAQSLKEFNVKSFLQLDTGVYNLTGKVSPVCENNLLNNRYMIKELEKKFDQHFKEYTSMKEHTADYFLILGKATATAECIQILANSKEH